MDLIQLNQFPSVTANGTATLVTDELRGKSVHAIIFEQGGTFTKAQMTNIRLRLNGKDIIQGINGAQLQDVNDYEGFEEVSSYAAYFFGDPKARTTKGQHFGDLDCSIYDNSFEIEVEIGAATSPTLRCWALVGVPKQAMGLDFTPLQAAMFRSLIRTVIQPAAAITRKTFSVSMGSEAGGRLRKLFFFNSNLTKVEYKKNSLTKYDDVGADLNSFVQKQYERTPQSGLYVLDRIVDGSQGQAETTVDPNGRIWNQQFALTTSGGDTITVFADMHAAWPQI